MESMGWMRVTRKLAGAVIALAIVLAVATPAHAIPTRREVKEQIRKAWEGNDKKAIRVADCESSLNPKATSPGGTYLGLWQFSRATWNAYDGPGNDPRDVSAYRQTLVAWRLFEDQGWAPWPSCGSA